MIGALANRAVILGVVAALAFSVGWKVNGWRMGEGIALQQVDAVTRARVIERNQQGVADAEGAKGHEELDELRRAVGDAGIVAAGLRKQASSLATQLATCNAGTAGEREARAEAGKVFADVLADVERRGRAMAEAADRARSAGLTCERVYDGVKAATEQK